MFEDLITEKKKPKKISDKMNLYCMRCGYNIDGLYEIGMCPICGNSLISIDK